MPGDRGVASVVPAADGASPDVALDIADLATVYLGAFTFADLVRAGRAPRVPRRRDRSRRYPIRRGRRAVVLDDVLRSRPA